MVLLEAPERSEAYSGFLCKLGLGKFVLLAPSYHTIGNRSSNVTRHSLIQ